MEPVGDAPLPPDGRALVYNPWLHVLGGGERVTLDLARALSNRFEVVIGSDHPPDPEQMKLLGFDFPGPLIVLSENDVPDASLSYDMVACVAIGPPPPVFSRRSLLYIQFPMMLPSGRVGRIDLRSCLATYRKAWSYSAFAANWTNRRWGIQPSVVPPPVRVPTPPVVARSRTILSVGRFATWGNLKRQDILVEGFRQLSADPAFADWKLVLVGGYDPGSGGERFFRSVGELAQGLNVQFERNASPKRLAQLYGEATLLWHATGYGRKRRHPEQAEHFGMSTVEAMGCGVVPVVYDDGGQTEIVTGEIGRTWHSVDELCMRSKELVNDPDLLEKLSVQARFASQKYSLAAFQATVDEFVRESSRDWAPPNPARWLSDYRVSITRPLSGPHRLRESVNELANRLMDRRSDG